MDSDLVGASAAAQIPGDNITYTALPQELAIDDSSPFTYGWSGVSHFGGLGVKTADFNKDGFEDIVVGGNGAVPVRIFYMMRNSVGNPAVEFVEILEEGTSPISGAGSWPNTFGCYGVTVGDFNQDSWPDIVVTRRLGMRFLGPPPSLPPNQGQHDSVWINDAVPGNPPTSGTAPTCFDNSIVIPLIPNSTLEHATYWTQQPLSDPLCPGCVSAAETFAVEVAYLDETSGGGTAYLDVITSGVYGVRYYKGGISGGTPTFTHLYTFIERNSLGNPTDGVYRNLTVGDVDADSDLDLIVTRGAAGSTASDRVWFNKTVPQPGWATLGANELFAWKDPAAGLASVPALQRTAVLGFLWRGVAGGPVAANSGSCTEGIGSFDSALGDLDGDLDLDLVVASNTCKNVAYINNGRGYFGAKNDHVAFPVNDGQIAFVFNSPTPHWPSATGYATSEFLFDFCFDTHHQPPTGGNATNIEFRRDGKLIDYTTSVRVVDLNADGFKDVAFANRNDWQDLCREPHYEINQPYGLPGRPYFNATIPAPDVYDWIYYGLAPHSDGTLRFRTCVEAVGHANDGTSYIEFANLGGDNSLDWVESNFANGWLESGDGLRHFPAETEWIPGDSATQTAGFFALGLSAFGLASQYPQDYEGFDNTFFFFGRRPPTDNPLGPCTPPQNP